MCSLCTRHEENVSHLFFLCPLSKEIWHKWWEAWCHGCIHAEFLIEFWDSLGRPPAKTTFLQVAWAVGPSFILWNLWLEHNRRIFCNSSMQSTNLWQRILSRLQETICAKCDMTEPVDPGDYNIVRNLGLVDKGLGSTSTKRSQPLKRKVCRVGRWRPPPMDILKINSDGSSRGNPGQAGVGGIGRDSDGNIIFMFFVYKGVHSNNVMGALAIKISIERGFSLGWRKMVCESDSTTIWESDSHILSMCSIAMYAFLLWDSLGLGVLLMHLC
jgi:hypothetical protein